MAPEQFRGGKLPLQVDIYALGVLFVECLTGKVPFDIEKQLSGTIQPERSSGDLLTSLFRDPPPPLGVLACKGMDPRLDRIARKCLRKGAARRYDSAARLASDLGRYLDPHDRDVDAEVLSRRIDEEDLADGDAVLMTRIEHERQGKRWWQRSTVLVFGGLLIAGFLYLTVSASLRVALLAETRLIQDASAYHQRVDDPGTSAVLLGHALVKAQGLDEDLQEAIRLGVTVARGQLLPLRNILEIGGEARGCAISPDGTLAVVGNSKGQVWYVDLVGAKFARIPAVTGDNFFRTGGDPDLDAVTDVAFDPLRLRFAVATIGGNIHVVDATTGKVVRKIGHPGQPMSVHFDPEGRRLLVAGSSGNAKRHPNPVRLAIYATETWKRTHTFPVDYDLYVAAFSPDGHRIAVGGGVPPHPGLAVWDPEAPVTPVRVLPQRARVFTLAFRPGYTSKLVTGDVNNLVRFWDFAKEKGQEADGPEIRHDKQVRAIAFSDDGRHMLVGGEDNSARVWDLTTRQPIGQRLEHRGQVRGGAIVRQTGRMVTVDFDDGIRVWDWEPTGKAGWVLPHPSPVWDATFNDAGDKVLTGCAGDLGAEGAGYVWYLNGAQSGQPTHRLIHGSDVMVARFRPGSSGQAVTCGNDGTVYFWDTVTGERVGNPLSHEGQIVYSAAFDLSGRRFAFAGRGGKVRVSNSDTESGPFRPGPLLTKDVAAFVWDLRFGPGGIPSRGREGRRPRLGPIHRGRASDRRSQPPRRREHREEPRRSSRRG